MQSITSSNSQEPQPVSFLTRGLIATAAASMSVWGAVEAMQGIWYLWIFVIVFLWLVFSWAGRTPKALPSFSPKHERYMRWAAAIIILFALLSVIQSAIW